MDRIFIRNRESGMTLTELLVVVTIILMLLLFAFIAYRSQIGKGYDARRKSDLHQIKVALEEYEKDNECYPPPPLECGTGSGRPLDPYMGGHVPCDPATGGAYVYYPENTPGCRSWFWIFTDLDYKQDPALIELGCGAGCGYQAAGPFYDYYAFSPNAPDIFVDTTGLFGCFEGSGGNECLGIPDSSYCQPHYSGLGFCEAQCPGATTYCD